MASDGEPTCSPGDHVVAPHPESGGRTDDREQSGSAADQRAAAAGPDAGNEDERESDAREDGNDTDDNDDTDAFVEDEPVASSAAAKGKKKKKNKGGRPGRKDDFTGPQIEFLLGVLPQFVAVRENHTNGVVRRHQDFWAKVHASFWEQFDWKSFRSDAKGGGKESQEQVMERVNKVRAIAIKTSLTHQITEND